MPDTISSKKLAALATAKGVRTLYEMFRYSRAPVWTVNDAVSVIQKERRRLRSRFEQRDHRIAELLASLAPDAFTGVSYAPLHDHLHPSEVGYIEAKRIRRSTTSIYADLTHLYHLDTGEECLVRRRRAGLTREAVALYLPCSASRIESFEMRDKDSQLRDHYLNLLRHGHPFKNHHNIEIPMDSPVGHADPAFMAFLDRVAGGEGACEYINQSEDKS